MYDIYSLDSLKKLGLEFDSFLEAENLPPANCELIEKAIYLEKFLAKIFPVKK
jgi:hypothetical protein